MIGLRFTTIIVLLISNPFYKGSLFAQQKSNLQLNMGSTGSIASKDYQPLWLVANKWGAFTDQKSDISSFLHADYTNVFGKPKRKTNDSTQWRPNWFAAAGANLVVNNHFKNVFFNAAYLKAGFGKVEIRAGRYQAVMGEVDPDLSSGSLATSGNALPIPMVTIAASDYIDVPFTKGWLQFKGSFSHGWMGSERYLKSWLHEKSFYLRLGKKQVKLFGGVVHDVEWAGQRGSLQLDNSWKGFWEVVTVVQADDGSTTSVRLHNRPGDQRGILDIGGSLETSKFILRGYHQTPFESGQGIAPKNIDNLSGLQLDIKSKKSFLSKLLLEFVYTKQMEDYYSAHYAQTYYNNGFYRTGWEYDNRIVGTPLFLNRYRASDYFTNIKPYNWSSSSGYNTNPGNSNILFVRVIGGHIGAQLLLNRNNHFELTAKTMATYTLSYKTRTDSHAYKQLYGMEQFSMRFLKTPLQVTMAFGGDAGDFTRNAGGQLGFTWYFVAKQW